jgi:tetratricopeptide (TPR) repeat protein
MSDSRINRRIENALDREDWEGARNLILGELKKEPQNHWFRTRLGTTYYEQRRYAEALKHFQMARRLFPSCPLVLWDYAGALTALGKPRKALRVYLDLIRKGPRKLARMRPCGEGLDWALGLVTDCMYSVGLCWERLGNAEKALKWYKAFLQARAECPQSIYSPEDALNHIKKLSNGNAKHMEHEIGILTKSLLGVKAKSA